MPPGEGRRPPIRRVISTGLGRRSSELEGTSLSPEALGKVEVEETPDDPVVLRRRDLLDLFDTSPDLSGMDIDVAPFIREDDQRSVLVCFREIGENGWPTDGGFPDRQEVVQVPLASLKARPCWKADHVNRSWERMSGRAVPPGSTVILDAADGGYTGELGWDGKSRGKSRSSSCPRSTAARRPTGTITRVARRRSCSRTSTDVYEVAKR